MPHTKWMPLTLGCQELGVPHQNAIRLIHRGLLKAERRGKRWYVERQSVRTVAAILREKTTQPAA